MGELVSLHNTVEFGPKPEVLEQIARWWGDRLIAERKDLETAPFYDQLKGEHGLNFPYYALVTHHCSRQENKQGIEELGGVIGVPDIFSVAYGKMASDQVLHSIGYSTNGLGKPYDGLTYVYMHAAGYELHNLCKNYFQALNAGPLARAFSDPKSLDVDHFCFQIVQAIQSPWERLTTDLTESEKGLNKLRKWLDRKIEYFDLNQPGFQYRLRRLENKFLLAII